jgi:hypothetical protein
MRQHVKEREGVSSIELAVKVVELLSLPTWVVQPPSTQPLGGSPTPNPTIGGFQTTFFGHWFNYPQ